MPGGRRACSTGRRTRPRPDVRWTPLVEHAVLKADSHNCLSVRDPRRWTHVRLRLDSDGGVARLRAYGEVISDPALWADVTVEVSGVEQGGRVEWCSDSFYSNARALIEPNRPRNMGDGWETRRRRDVGPETHDAVLISFAAAADLVRIEVDTSYFVFNASTGVSILGSRAFPDGEHGWALVPFDVAVLPRTRLVPDARQLFTVDARGVTALRVQAYPDGGSRGCARSARQPMMAWHGFAGYGRSRSDDPGAGRLRRPVEAHVADRRRRLPRYWHRCAVAAGHHRLRRLARLRGQAASERRHLRVAPRHRSPAAGSVPGRGFDAVGRSGTGRDGCIRGLRRALGARHDAGKTCAAHSFSPNPTVATDF